MTDDLRDDMKAGFKKVDDEFLAVRNEFVAVRAEMTAGFKKVDNEFVAVRNEFVAVRAEMTAGFKKVDDQIKAEGETTRRCFDIVAEQFKEYVKVLADGTARHTERLDDHEKRLDGHEKRLTVLEHPHS